MTTTKTYRVRVSEAGVAYYHAFNLWPEARPLSNGQQKVLNLFGFLIKHGKQLEPMRHYEVADDEKASSLVLVDIMVAYRRIHKCGWTEADAQIGVTASFFDFLVMANMLIVEEVNNG